MSQPHVKLSPYHKIFYNEWKLDPNNIKYNIVFDQIQSKNLDIEKLRSALIRFIRDHFVLNSHVFELDNEAYWINNKYVKELEHFEGSYDYQQILEYVSEPFKLDSEPLYRFALFNEPDGNYRFILVWHHILMDGEGTDKSINQISNYYNQLAYKITHSLDEQQQTLSAISNSLEKQLQDHEDKFKNFWENILVDIEPLDLRFLKLTKIGEESNKRFKEIRFDLSPIDRSILTKVTRELKITPYIYSRCIVAILLYRYTDQTNVAISFPVIVKHGVEFICGAQVNTNLIISKFNKQSTFLDLVGQTKDFLKSTKAVNLNYKHYPINKIMKKANKGLLDVIFAETNLKDTKFTFEDIDVLKINSEFNIDIAAPLFFEHETRDKNINFRVRYNESEVDGVILNNFVQHYQQLFLEILDDLSNGINNKPVNQYKILTDSEYNKIVYEWNETSSAYPRDKTIHQLFEEQVLKTPNNIALIYNDIQLTYNELNQKANKLAHYLRKTYRIKGDNLIALCLDRSEKMLIIILGILKSGGAYVPIDPTYPDARIEYILSNINAKVLLAGESYEIRLMNTIKHLKVKTKIEVVNDNFFHSLTTHNANNPIHNVKNRNIAYIIYTSGTTGNPKGAILEHRGIVNRITWMNNQYPLTSFDRILQKTPYVFDVSVWELFWANWYGASIVIAETEGHRDPNYLSNLIQDKKVSIIHFVPSMLSMFNQAMSSDKTSSNLISLRHIFCSGETLSLSQVQDVHRILPDVAIHNLYGPTEASIDVLHYNCSSKSLNQVYIGKPIANTTAYVLDSNMNPSPIGAIGELYVGGDGLARGYLKLKKLAAEKFIPNPFQTNEEKDQNKNSRLYKTGDLVRYFPDGNIQYIGREDHQVKLRGFRIELNEIEAWLSSYPGIKKSIVAVKWLNHGDYQAGTLIGYYVASHRLDENKIRNHLFTQLPNYMIPETLIWLMETPLTINGKLDYNALPEPKFQQSRYEHKINYRSELEQSVCNILANVLDLRKDTISPEENFFSLGGNSISALHFKNQVYSSLGIKFDLPTILKSPSIAKLVDNDHQDLLQDIIKTKEKIDAPAQYKLSFAQERLYFIHELTGNTATYNMSMVLKLNIKSDISIFSTSLLNVLNRHEILRTVIGKTKSSENYQLVLPVNLDIEHRNVKSISELEKLINQDVTYYFNLEKEIPIKVYLYQLKTTHYVNFVFHHIAFDGWSRDVFKRDLIEYYNYNLNKINGSSIALNIPDLTIQYKDFTLWQREYIYNDKYDIQIDYWLKKLDNYSSLRLPIDKPRPYIFNYQGATLEYKLSKNLSVNLRKNAQNLGVSLYSLLLSAFYLLMRVYSNQNDITIGTASSNRHYRQIEDLIGFFVNTLVLRQVIDSSQSLKEFVKQVSHEVLELHAYQDMPFELLVKALSSDTDLTKHPICQVMFIVQHFGSFYKNELFEDFNSAVSNTSKFDLTLTVNDESDPLEVSIEYYISIFNKETIESFFYTFENILDQMVILLNSSSPKTIRDIEYVKPDQLKIIDLYCTGKESIIPNKNIHQLFEEQVLKTPDDIAIVYENISLTYSELNKKSNQLSHYLISVYNIIPNDLIALCLDRNEAIIIVIIGILKAGAAYVPIDPLYPKSRIDYILNDANPNLTITSELHKEKIISNHRAFISINDLDYLYNVDKQPTHNLYTLQHTLNNLAYVIYTSGTTGSPKGVMVEYYGVINLINSLINSYKLTPKKHVACFSNVVFDAFVYEFFPAIVSGCTVFLLSNQIRHDINKLVDYYINNNVAISFIPTSIISEFINHYHGSSIEIIHSGGDSMSSAIGKLTNIDYTLMNEYGTTEVTVCSTQYEMKPSNLNYDLIGTPIDNTRYYILNEDQKILPINAIGELHLSGAGIARGYINSASLTDKFINNKFFKKNDHAHYKNLYKTGDLTRLLPDGNLAFIGRHDSQVKIRGYRIEPREIEQAINSYPGVTKSLVLMTDNKKSPSNKYLVGYYVKNIAMSKENDSDYIQNWEKIYDLTYSTLNIKNYKQNFIGWKSSYTGNEIPLKEMLEWRDDIINKIKSISPKNILEIGSGAGLIMFNIVNNCNHYYATDFSAEAVDYIEKVITHYNYKNKISTFKCQASEVPYSLLSTRYDTVIMNSVVQYFPNLEYLEKVITQLINHIADNGKIFIGDIRDHRLLNCFYYSILEKNKSGVSVSEIDYFAKRDKELLISPDYFMNLKTKYSCIYNVEIMPKMYKSNNEMSCYRFDVMLKINKSCKNSSSTLIDLLVDNSLFIKRSNLSSYIINNHESTENLYIKYPNKRIYHDYYKLNYLYNITVDLPYENYDSLLNLEEVTLLFKEHNYSAKIFIDALDPTYFNIVACKSNDIDSVQINYDTSIVSLKSANSPLLNLTLLDQQQNKDMLKFLEKLLPDYMIPKQLILLDQFPLTTNGKIDRSMLPSPGVSRTEAYVPPRNTYEMKLCDAFSLTLGIVNESVSIKDDFFKLGGNSVLSIQLAFQINKIFNTNLTVTNIFVNKTIERLATVLQEVKKDFQLITCLNLNVNSSKPDIFMIHPAAAGVEVYTDLAENLSAKFNCYGVDNYNLHNEDKIDALGKLALYYLSEIKSFRKTSFKENTPYILLGWSLGGHIALEIASLLEKEQLSDIKVILLDPLLPDNEILYYLTHLTQNESIIHRSLIEDGHLLEYINKVIATFNCENAIAQCFPSSYLKNTKILLFKATKINHSEVSLYNDMHKYSSYLPYNNVNMISEITNIELIKINDASHLSIIKQNKVIVDGVMEWVQL